MTELLLIVIIICLLLNDSAESKRDVRQLDELKKTNKLLSSIDKFIKEK